MIVLSFKFMSVDSIYVPTQTIIISQVGGYTEQLQLMPVIIQPSTNNNNTK